MVCGKIMLSHHGHTLAITKLKQTKLKEVCKHQFYWYVIQENTGLPPAPNEKLANDCII